MNIRDLILSIEVERDETIRHRDRALAEARHILETAKQDGRASLTEEEQTDVEAAMSRRARAEKDLVGIEAKLSSATEIAEAERAADAKLREVADEATNQAHGGTAQRPQRRAVVSVGREERTYHQGSAGRAGEGFVRDVLWQFLYRDVESEARLTQHMREERIERGGKLERAVGTGAFAGLTVPQYLTEMFAPAAAALSPFADVCNKHPLPPDGMTVNISRITTASGVGIQATENTAVLNTDMDDTLLTENVQTIAGQQTISRQAIDRGTGIEGVVLDDLFRRYSTVKDSTLLNQAATGMTNVATATAYTDATPTGPELYPKILGAQAGVDAALMGFGTPDVAVMHSRRWAWLQSQLTSTWPMISQPNINPQVMGSNLGTRYGAGARGVLPNGLVVIVDNNVATTLGGGTEDEIYIVPTSECHLWEDPDAPVFIRAEQAAAANLGVLLVLYGYIAYSFRRFTNGMGKVNGTGLIAPTF